MKTHDQQVDEAQDVLHKQIVKLLNKYGGEVTLEALATQFGICGAAALLCEMIAPPDFVGKYVLRAIAVCDTTAKKHHIEGVL